MAKPIERAGADFLAVNEHAKFLADQLQRLVRGSKVLLVLADWCTFVIEHRLGGLAHLHVLDQLREHPRFVYRRFGNHGGNRRLVFFFLFTAQVRHSVGNVRLRQ